MSPDQLAAYVEVFCALNSAEAPKAFPVSTGSTSNASLTNADHDKTSHVSHETRIDEAAQAVADALLNGSVDIATVVEACGEYLTSEIGGIRSRATALICEVIRRGGSDLALTPEQVAFLTAYFCSRMEHDWESLLPCLRGIELLIEFHGHSLPPNNLAAAVKAALSAQNVSEMAQPLRSVAYSIALAVARKYPSALVKDPSASLAAAAMDMDNDDQDNDAIVAHMDAHWFGNAFLGAMDGEKDPRCLLKCLAVITLVLRDDRLGGDSWVEDAFEGTSVYFPVTFRPPPNDPHGLTHDVLVSALNEVFKARPRMADCVIPMALERIRLTSSEAELARVEALKALSACAPFYGPAGLSPYLAEIRDALLAIVNSPEESSLLAESLEAFKVIVRMLTPSEDETTAWGVFVGHSLSKCASALRESLDSMASRGAATTLVAVAESSTHGFAASADVILPLAESKSLSRDPSEAIASIDLLVSLVERVRTDVAYTPGSGPLDAEAKRRTLAVLHSVLERHSSPRGEDERYKVAVSVRGIRAVLLRTNDGAEATEEEVAAASTVCADLLLWSVDQGDDGAVVDECLRTLTELEALVARRDLSVPRATTHRVFPALSRMLETKPVRSAARLVATVVLAGLCAGNEGATRVVAPVLLDAATSAAWGEDHDSFDAFAAVSRLIEVAPAAALDEVFGDDVVDQLLRVAGRGEPSRTAVGARRSLALLARRVSAERNKVLTERALALLAQSTIGGTGEEQLLLSARRESLPPPAAVRDAVAAALAQRNFALAASLVNKMESGSDLDVVVLGTTSVSVEGVVTPDEVDRLSAIFRALVLRGHPSSARVGETLLTLAISAKDEAARRAAARAFGDAMEEPAPAGLNRASFARVTTVYLQKLYETYFSRLFEASLGNNNSAALMGAVQLVSRAPLPVLARHLDPALLAAVQAASSIVGQAHEADSFSGELAHPVVRCMAHFCHGDKAMVEKLAPHLNVVVPFFLECAKVQSDEELRVASLTALSALPGSLPYHRLHPFRTQVALGLISGPLDDSKKRVRRAAVVCRERWAMFSSTA